MRASILSFCTAVVLILSLGLTGAASAGMASPDRNEAARTVFLLEHGANPADICGEDAAHGQHCPLCHGLPDAPSCGHDGIAARMIPHDGWRRLRDLHRAAQSRDLSHGPRAPPGRG